MSILQVLNLLYSDILTVPTMQKLKETAGQAQLALVGKKKVGCISLTYDRGIMNCLKQNHLMDM